MSVMTMKNQNATSKQPKPNNARCQWWKRLTKDQTNNTHDSTDPVKTHVVDNGTLSQKAGYASVKKPGAATARPMKILVLRERGWRTWGACRSLPHVFMN
jgi:hypothetical protein